MNQCLEYLHVNCWWRNWYSAVEYLYWYGIVKQDHDILLSLIFSYAPNGDVSVQRTWKLNTVKLNYSTKLLHELHCCSCYSWSVYALEQHRLYHKAIKCFLISRSPHKMTWWATLHPRAFSFTHAVKQKLLHVVSKESEFLNIGIVIDSLLPLSQSTWGALIDFEHDVTGVWGFC